MNALLPLTIGLPLLGALVLILFGASMPKKLAGVIGCASVGMSCVAALVAAWMFLTEPGAKAFGTTLYRWIGVDGLQVPAGLYLDPLSLLMMLVVTFVGFMIHLYAAQSMYDEDGYARFFAYMNLFVGSMLTLVLADNLLLLYLGWEGVGLCSYLLIGFWYRDRNNGYAAQKAFIVTRIGDTAMAIGLFLIFWQLGTLNIQPVLALAQRSWPVAGAAVTLVAFLLLAGAVGKSAQVPLQTWLPDAMAGPTPVSALIHAATMVTAGVYLVVRMSALFALAPATMLTIAIVAALTAFVAGSIAMTQRDIKKVLAYSTVSQLGFMFLACGCGAFVAGIFHVFTHAFFKACLFLGAGSVIHAAHHVQDLTKMGGLRHKMRQTWLTFLFACLAIAGFPLTAGFISKDEILTQTFVSGHFWLYAIGVVTALMTAAYSFRALFLTFHGESRMDAHTAAHVHESPWTMTLPLWILGIGALVAGALNLPAPLMHLVGIHAEAGIVGTFLDPIVEPARRIMTIHGAGEHTALGLPKELAIMGFSVLIAFAGIALAFAFCLKAWPGRAERLAERLGPLYRLSYNRWWWDDFYNVAVAANLRKLARAATWFDANIIDGVLHGVGGSARLGSRLLRYFQNGQVQTYALAILLGVNVVVWLVLWIR